MGSTFGLVQLLDGLLRRTTYNHVSETSTTSCVGGLAGSGTRFGVGTRVVVGHVACASTASRMLPMFSRSATIVDGGSQT
jgi:hypothetical protein